MRDLLDKIDNWVQSGPTANDKHMDPYTMIQLGLGLYGTWKSQQDQPKWSDTKNKLTNLFSNTSGMIDNLKNRSGDLFNYGDKIVGRGDSLWSKALQYHDPSSEINQSAYNQFSNNLQDTSTIANRMGNRNTSSLGLLGATGGQQIGQSNALNTDLSTQLSKSWQNYINNSRGTGNTLFGNATSLYGQGTNIYGQAGSLLSNAANMTSSMDSMFTNAYINHIANKQGVNQDFWGQFANAQFANMGGSSDPSGTGTNINIYNDGTPVDPDQG